MTCLLCVATYKQVQTVDFEAPCWHSFYSLTPTTTFPLHSGPHLGAYTTCTSSLLQRVGVHMVCALYWYEFSLNQLLRLTFLP